MDAALQPGALDALLPPVAPGDYGPMTASYDVRYDEAGLAKLFTRPLDEALVRRTMRTVVLTSYVRFRGLLADLGWAYWTPGGLRPLEGRAALLREGVGAGVSHGGLALRRAGGARPRRAAADAAARARGALQHRGRPDGRAAGARGAHQRRRTPAGRPSRRTRSSARSAASARRSRRSATSASRSTRPSRCSTRSSARRPARGAPRRSP